MALVSMRQLLDHAAENSYGLPAFNVNNLEQMRAIMEAADQVNAPVIVQASAGARKYAGAPFLRHLILAAVEEFPHIPVVMHQDHGASPDVCQRSIQLGFSSVMMDGSLMEDGKTPSSYEYNVNATRTVVNFSHACGVSVEGEIGVLGNLETGEAGEEDGVGEVVPVRQGHGRLAIEGPGRVEVPDDPAGLVLAHPEAQGQQVLDRVRPASADGGCQHADNAALGGGELGGPDGEARFHPPGLQGSCESQEEDGHQARSSRLARGATT